jgi:serine/threonine-protein kinase
MSDTARKTLKIRCPLCSQKLDVTGVPGFSEVACPNCKGGITVPQPFGPFLLEELIGEGRVARVYRALDTTLDREVAVKVINDTVRDTPGGPEAFLAHAKRMAAVTHPRVLPIYSCGEWEGRACLVMQYMSRLSLAFRLQQAKGGLPLEFSLRTFRETVQGLEAAGRSGILHHNLCPSNVLIDAEGEVKVGDFGLSLAGWSAERGLRENLRTTLGVLSYVSPERGLSGQQDVRGDIYSLGATLYHVLTGRAPFFGENSEEAFRHRLSEPPVAPRLLRKDIPEPLDGLLMAMLAGRPEERPQSYTEVAAGIEALARPALRYGAKRRATPPPPARPGAGGGAARPPRSPPPTPALDAAAGARPAQAGSRVGTAIFLVLVLLLGLVLWAGVQRSPWYVSHLKPSVDSVKEWASRLRVRRLDGTVVEPLPRRSPAPPPPVRDALPQSPSPGTSGAGGPASPAASAPPGNGALDAAVATLPPGRATPVPAAQPVPAPAPAPDPDPAAGAEEWGEADESEEWDTTSPEPPPPPPQVAPPAATARPVTASAPKPAYVAQRPRPEDIDFFKIKPALEEYLRQVPQEMRVLEAERIREISSLRPTLLQYLKFPYDGSRRGVLLRGGRRLTGTVLGNDRELVVRPQTGKYRRLRWDELAFQQYVAFFDFYIEARLERGNPEDEAAAAVEKVVGSSPAAAPGASRQAAAGYDCFRVALLCDWYGEAALASTYARRAVDLDAALDYRLGRLLPGVVAGRAP